MPPFNCKSLAALAGRAVAIACVAMVTSATAQACNAGVQYFSLAGYKTAAVFADGMQSAPAEFIFGDQAPLVVRALERRNFPSDPVAVGNNILYLETDSERIIFDTGNGLAGDEGAGFLLASLEAQGIPADTITHVLITHGHPDHVSGLVLNGTMAFPGATVYVPRVEFDYWMALQEDSVAADIFEQIEPQIELFEFGDEVLPNITAVRNATWHTPGHVIYRVDAADGGALYYAGDSLTHEVFGISMPYITLLFDIDPSSAPAGRVELLDFLAAEKSLLITTHATFPPLGTVFNDGLYFELQKIPPQFAAGVGTMCSA